MSGLIRVVLSKELVSAFEGKHAPLPPVIRTHEIGFFNFAIFQEAIKITTLYDKSRQRLQVGTANREGPQFKGPTRGKRILMPSVLC